MIVDPVILTRVTNYIEGYIENLTKHELNISMRDVIKTLPLNAEACYFCILHEYGETKISHHCNICEYAKIHKQCDTHGSTWREIIGAMDILYEAFELFAHTANPINTHQIRLLYAHSLTCMKKADSVELLMQIKYSLLKEIIYILPYKSRFRSHYSLVMAKLSDYHKSGDVYLQ